MPNIFDGLVKAPDQDILEQLALLEAINMTNVLKPYGINLHKGAISLVNKVGGFFNKDFGMEEPESMELWDYIDVKREEFKGLSRAELDSLMVNTLISKSRIARDNNTLDAISVRVIEEAAELLDVSKDLTPAQKADGIHRRFSERMLENIQKGLKKQDSEAARKTIEVLQKSLEEMNDEQRKQVRNALKVDELTGETVRSALLKAGAPAAILATVSLSGFGAFLALTTVLHAVFTTLLGITLPFIVYTSAASVVSILTGPVGILLIAGVFSYQFFKGGRKLERELLAQIVWFAVTMNGNYFTPRDEELPSWVPKEHHEEVERNEAEYKTLVQEKEKAVNIAKESSKKLENVLLQLKTQEQLLEKEKRKRTQAEKNLADLSTTKEKLIADQKQASERVRFLESNLASQSDVDSELQAALLQARKKAEALGKSLGEVNSKLHYQNQVIELASDEISQVSERAKKLEFFNVQLQEENNYFREQAEAENAKVEIKEEGRRKEITERWLAYFDDFEIEPRAVRDVVRFSRLELQAVEKRLMELHYTKDPRALSRGKVKELSEEFDHLGFSFPDGFPTRLLYKILGSQKPRIRIVRVYKHNEKFLK